MAIKLCIILFKLILWPGIEINYCDILTVLPQAVCDKSWLFFTAHPASVTSACSFPFYHPPLPIAQVPGGQADVYWFHHTLTASLPMQMALWDLGQTSPESVIVEPNRFQRELCFICTPTATDRGHNVVHFGTDGLPKCPYPEQWRNPSSFSYSVTKWGPWMSLLQATVLIPEVAAELERKHTLKVSPGIGVIANAIFITVA